MTLFFARPASQALAEGAGKEVEDFGGGEGEPDEAVGDDEDAQNTPDDQTCAVKWRRGIDIGCGGAGWTFAGPALPETPQAVGDFRGGEQNDQTHAQDASADQVLNQRVVHCGRI